MNATAVKFVAATAFAMTIVKIWCEPDPCDGETEVTDTVGVARVTVAEADRVESARLVAMTLTVWVELALEGAVYKPVLEIVPKLGLIDQVTAVLVDPVTVAVNC